MTNGEGTHYDVIGVDPGASKEDIRAAYRSRLDELAGDTSDNARAETARLNSAWQVLSDPYQRGRYDAQEGIEAEAPADDGGGDEDDSTADDSRVPARRERGRGRGRDGDESQPTRVSLFSAEPIDPPPTWPPGFRPPPPRARLIAMFIDLLVLFVLVLAVQTAGARVIDSVYEEEVDRIDVLDERLDDADEAQDRAEERADDARDEAERAERQGDTAAEEEARQRARAADDEAEQAENKGDRIQDQIDDLNGELVPAQLMLTGTVLVVALLYLVPATVLTGGRTLGKQLLGVRLINQDGTRIGVRGALVHYGAPVLVALAFSPILGQLVVFVVLIGVLTWPRNPNLQGMHDRLAGTLIVDG